KQAAAVEGTIEDPRREITEARDRAEKATQHALELEARIARLEADAARLARERDEARSERDVQTERADMAAQELAALRAADEQMRRQLDAGLQAAVHAEAHAGVAERARAMVEDGVRQLRDEITTAFTCVRLVAPSLAPPPAEPLSDRIKASVPPPPRPPFE